MSKSQSFSDSESRYRTIGSPGQYDKPFATICLTCRAKESICNDCLDELQKFTWEAQILLGKCHGIIGCFGRSSNPYSRENLYLNELENEEQRLARRSIRNRSTKKALK